MSYVRLNIIDNEQTISGEVHGFLGDALVAALTAEPETVGELAAALGRFIKPASEWPVFQGFAGHELFEPYDAGVLVIDLAARVVAVESTYSCPAVSGSVRVQSDFADDDEDIMVPYRLPDDWLFVYSIPEYEGVCRERRRARRALPPLEAREVLYGKALPEFIRQQWSAAHGEFVSEAIGLDEDARAEVRWKTMGRIHEQWLMTAREDLRGQTVREVLFAKRDFIDFELHSRALQWSFAKECPPALPVDSHAYKFAGIGAHEWVVYYDLIRYLLESCFEQDGPEAEQLAKLQEDWLNQPSADFSGRTPAHIIDTERRRVNLTASAQKCIIDEDCEVCQMMAADFDTPMFWHLDGCNMDEGFAFSFYETRDEYEAEQLRWQEFDKEFERKRKAGEYDNPFAESLVGLDDEDAPF